MICFRSDGTIDIGMGHVFRSISLAKELTAFDEIIFFVEKSKKARELIVSNGFPVTAPELIHEFIKSEKDKVIIITDLIEKDLTESWCKAISEYKNVIHVGIHDLGLNQFDSDVIIDGSIGNIDSYSRKEEKKYFLGKEYMIINSNFEKYIGMSKDYFKVMDKISLCFGGSDPSNITESILPKLSQHFKNIEFLTIAGPENESVARLKNKFDNVKVLFGLKDISNILFESDILITSGGILLYEAACVGTPTIAICLDKEQNKTANLFQKAGASLSLGLYKTLNEKDLISNLEDLTKNPKKRKKMGLKGKELIDGKGVFRTAAIIKELTGKVDRNERN